MIDPFGEGQHVGVIEMCVVDDEVLVAFFLVVLVEMVEVLEEEAQEFVDLEVASDLVAGKQRARGLGGLMEARGLVGR